jgi:hypothetical protein
LSIICVFSQEEKKTPVLIINKSAPVHSIVGTNLTFSFTLYNVGEGDAYEVEVIDNKWNKDFKILDGKRKNKFQVIKAGENVSFSYTVVPSKTFELSTKPAVITYKTEENEKEFRIARSTGLPTISVVTPSEYYKRTTTHRVNIKNLTVD